MCENRKIPGLHFCNLGISLAFTALIQLLFHVFKLLPYHGRAKGLFFFFAPCALFILFFLVVYDDVLFDLFTGVLVDAERFRDL